MIESDSTAQVVAIIFSILWSFCMEYLWFFKKWLATLDVAKIQTVNAAGVFLVVAVAFTLSMFEVIDWFTRDAAGVLEAFLTFFIALGIAQGVHHGTKALKRAKVVEEEVE